MHNRKEELLDKRLEMMLKWWQRWLGVWVWGFLLCIWLSSNSLFSFSFFTLHCFSEPAFFLVGFSSFLLLFLYGVGFCFKTVTSLDGDIAFLPISFFSPSIASCLRSSTSGVSIIDHDDGSELTHFASLRAPLFFLLFFFLLSFLFFFSLPVCSIFVLVVTTITASCRIF